MLFKIFRAKCIHFSFELKTINTNPKLTRISKKPLRFVGSNRELFTEWKSGTATASKLISLLVITNSPYIVLKIFTPMSTRRSLYARIGRNLCIGRTLGSIRGLRGGLGRIKLLKFDNLPICERCPGIYKKYHRPQE